jgi:tetratricopeptide (TPR) repeat protein/CHAT domain-containing protein
MRALRFSVLIVSLLCLGIGAASGQTAADVERLRRQAEQLHGAGTYAEALAMQRTVVAGIEKADAGRAGAAREETAGELVALSWYALFARAPAEALRASERAGALMPGLLADTNRAHALLFLGRTREARRLYLAHKGKRMSPESDRTWEDAIAEDYVALRAAGIVHKAFPGIVAQLGVEHPELNAEIEALRKRVDELYAAGKYQEAAADAETLVTLTGRRFAEGRTELAGALRRLANSREKLGQSGEAETLYRRSLAIYEKAVGTDHPDVATTLAGLARLYRDQGRYGEAEPLLRRVLAMTEKTLGADHPTVSTALNNLALLLAATNRLAEAEPLYRRALAIDEKSSGPDHPNTAIDANNLARLLHETNRAAEAEPLYRRALAIDEKSLGPDHPSVARDLNNLAALLEDESRLAEAERLHRRALAIIEKRLGSDHAEVAAHLNNLAGLLLATNRLAEAEQLYRRALAITEKNRGPDHPNVASALNNLAQLLKDTNRPGDAEPLFRRAVAITEKVFGPDHPNVAASLNNLAGLLLDTKRPAEAEALYRRALAIDEGSYGPDHPDVATSLNNLAGLLHRTNRLREAEPLFRRALAIDERSLGPDHPSVATTLDNLALLLQDTGRFGDAEPLFRRALAIEERSLGADHPNVALRLHSLALLRAELGDWAGAARLHRRAAPILTAAQGGSGGNLARAELVQNSGSLRAAARAVQRDGGDSAEAREEGFQLAQWALQTSAADALAQMSVRFAKGAGPLAGLVRQRQDLVARRQGEDKRLLAAIGKADARAGDTIRAAIADLDARLVDIDRKLAAEFPEYAELSSPQPLAIAAVQGLLGDDEALVVFLDVWQPRPSKLPPETLAWAVTRRQARWVSIPLGPTALAERVARLRCGLDRDGNWTWSPQRGRWEATSEPCRVLRPDGLADDEPLPFDVGGAHELYAELLGPLADLTAGKSLIVVPSGPLTSLPFQVLVTESDGATASDPKGPAPIPGPVSWLALKQPITVLPSVGSLAALRKLPPSLAREPYLAFGNPLLDGDVPERVQLARAKQSCRQATGSPHQGVARAARGVAARGARIRGGINMAALRAQAPLPETADELCAVARSLGALGAGGQEADTVWLGARATEANLKALSRSGRLALYRVLHFATHGVLAGESEAILKARAEPALILTPPQDGVAPAELEEDDGLLTASEVAQLDLDADWVVLSACNTAAGEKGDATALSGLARAFFYAKARALLVSHWYVNSDAAVNLTTVAFAELSAHPEIGRAEALRRSIVRLIASGRPEEAQPEYWAPFVLVGEGAR